MTHEDDPVETLRFSGLTWHVCGGDTARMESWLSAHFPAVLDNRENLLKDDKGSRVAAVEGLVVKESTARKGRSALRFGLRRSGSCRAFRLGRQLAECGVSTPLPVAWATVRRFGLRVKDYLVTEKVESHVSLADKLETCRENSDERRRLMELLGRLLASFHVNGFSNRDLKDTNMLVTGSDSPRLWTVDLDGVRKMRWITRRRARRDFWPIVRSLKRHGYGDGTDQAGLLRGYGAVVPLRLRLYQSPESWSSG
jgi:tRNA A-37 threonylcarbamoyl transferase component Bud32